MNSGLFVCTSPPRHAAEPGDVSVGLTLTRGQVTLSSNKFLYFNTPFILSVEPGVVTSNESVDFAMTVDRYDWDTIEMLVHEGNLTCKVGGSDFGVAVVQTGRIVCKSLHISEIGQPEVFLSISTGYVWPTGHMITSVPQPLVSSVEPSMGPEEGGEQGTDKIFSNSLHEFATKKAEANLAVSVRGPHILIKGRLHAQHLQILSVQSEYLFL